MTAELARVAPEIALFVTTCIVMLLGLSPSAAVRQGCLWFSMLGILVALALTPLSAYGVQTDPRLGAALFPALMPYAKALIAVVALMLLPIMAGTVDRDEESAIAAGIRAFNPLRSNRAEFYAFFLFSITGLMLTASADDLIWLFLALELTSLPTYVMVAISTRRTRSQEAGVKYFFLGALGAATFLYGFALMYGAAGSTRLADIAAVFQGARLEGAGLSTLAIAGVVTALIGVSFKIAAVPMHFYAADVYQGAASGVSAMLAFVPKAGGFIAILLICGTVGWGAGLDGEGLPEPIYWLLAVLACATMFVGNAFALVQRSVKRMLAYSSVAHSGYMLVGVIAGPDLSADRTFASDGIAATLFYLLTYGVMNAGAFAVLASLEHADKTDDGRPTGTGEIDDIDDLRGLWKTRPALAISMAVCVLSLLGLPPLLGFFGKFGLFVSAMTRGEVVLVVILGLNSAIAAFYYLRIVSAAFLDKPAVEDEPAQGAAEPPKPVLAVPFMTRRVAAITSAGGVLTLLFFTAPLMDRSLAAAEFQSPDFPDSASESPYRALPATATDEDQPETLSEVPVASIDSN